MGRSDRDRGDRPAAASRRSTAWAVASGTLPGTGAGSCPSTSALAASSSAGHRQQRTQRKSHVPRYPARGVRTVVAVLRPASANLRFCAAGQSNSPTCHVENCGHPARGLDSTGARSAIAGGCMTAADGKRGHRFRTNHGQPRDAARRGREQHGRGDPGGARGSHFLRHRLHPVLQSTEWTHPGKVEAPYTVCIASASNLTGLVKSSVECRRTGL